MRLAGLGWVEKSLSWAWACSGLMMNICAVAGLRSAVSLSMRWASPEILSSAEASQSGLPQMSAPTRSASYSRLRLMAICTRPAAMGARIISASVPMRPMPLLRLPPKNIAKLASIEMAPAKVAVTVMIVVSWLRIWASSCAMTAAISSRERLRRRPFVAATAELAGLRPVAKALG